MKKIILLITFIFSSTFSFSQNATLKGVVMYFFNDNFGDKPDIGSEIYLLRDNSRPYNSLKECVSVDYLKIIEEYNRLLDEFKETDKELSKVLVVMPKDLKNRRKQLKKDLELHLSKIHDMEYSQTECMKSILNNLNKNSNEIIGFEVVDGSGIFTFQNLEFGMYGIYIKSKQRSGKWRYLQININKNNQTISHTFYPEVNLTKKVVVSDDTY
jgi:hypothetical protein